MAKNKGGGLDGRSRDQNGETHAKNGTTRIGTLREIYGEQFAQGRRADMHLSTLLEETQQASLSQYLKNPDK